MRSFVTDNYGRFVVLHLSKGDLVLESIKEELSRLGIKNAVMLSAIGSLRKLAFHTITELADVSVDEFVTLERPFELGAMQGLVLNGEPHIHLICSDPKQMYLGHLEPGSEVQYLMEMSFLEVLDLDLTRRKDQFGIPYIDEK